MNTTLLRRARGLFATVAISGFLLIPFGAFAQLPTPTYGWNLGNDHEALPNPGAWGPTATQALINNVADAGFNVIRIPCAWDTHADQSTLQIDPAFMARVKEVVDWCYARNLYVIVNCHWDGGWLDENIGDTPDPVVTQKMNSYWTQISKAFSDYDEHLVFAGANEPPAHTAAEVATLMDYYQTFIDAVRATGGNNSTRWLAIQGPNTNIDVTYDMVNTLPSDTTPGRLMVEVHHYPFQWSIMDADASWGKMFYFWGQGYHSPTMTDRNSTWGEEDYTDEQFQKMADKFTSKGIPVILGEWGAMKRTGYSDLTGTELVRHLASRTYYYKTITRKANALGIKPIYWDAGGTGRNTMWLFDRSQASAPLIDPDAARALTGGPALLPSGELEEVASVVPEYGWAPFTVGQAGTWMPTGSWVESGLTYSAVGLPDWASLDATTGTISGTPPGGAAGTVVQATITVTAGAELLGRQKLNLVMATPGSGLSPVNMATRGVVGAGEQALALGFVVGGDSPRDFLIRAVGPTIGAAPYHVGGVLADPQLAVYRQQGAILSSNDNWEDAADSAVIAATSAGVGAFALNAGSRDAALQVTLEPGLYSARATGAENGTGVALVEFYDVTSGPSGGTLLNVSTSARVGTGDEVLIPGLVLRGDGTRRLLVRAVGPTLADYDVDGVLPDPHMTLVKDGQVLATNDDWGQGTDVAEIKAVGAAVGAFPLPDQSRDAVLLATVPAGAYSVVLRGVGDSTGIALLEVYLVP